MAGLPEITREYFEILVVRELRKAGFEVTDSRVHRRTELPEPERGFLLELRAWLTRGEWRQRALIACRRQEGAIGREAVEQLAGRLTAAEAGVGLLFTPAELAAEALAAGEERGVALLRLVDARTAYDTGGWGAPGHYPSWLPAYLVQLVDRGGTRLLEAGGAALIVNSLTEAPHG